MFLLTIFETVSGVFEWLSDIISKLSSDPQTAMLIVTFGILFIITVISYIFAMKSIEAKTGQAISNINKYLKKNPFINDDNLVEFNKLMKKLPKSMRYQWQQYMLSRDSLPSKYLSHENVIEKPFKYSSYKQIIDYVKTISMVFVVLLFALSLVSLKSDLLMPTGELLYQASVSPVLLLIYSSLFTIILKSRRVAITVDIEYKLKDLQVSLDKAMETMPKFVDYEILFSKKEIKMGIPALQSYLEKRAKYEQEQIEKAKLSAVNHDKYNFSNLGLDGSLVMERAMRESEYYLGNRSRLLTEITQLEDEKRARTETHNEDIKGLQRKIRDVKETISRLKSNLDESTNKIDANYIRKQQAEETQKLQALEKEMVVITSRFNKDIDISNKEIKSRTDEVDAQRRFIQSIMSGEFNEYNKKVYEELQGNISEDTQEYKEELEKEKKQLKEELEKHKELLKEKDILYKEKVNVTFSQKELLLENDNTISDQEDKIKKLEERVKELRRAKIIQRYFDHKGKEFFIDKYGKKYYMEEDKKVYFDDKDDSDESNSITPSKEDEKNKTKKEDKKNNENVKDKTVKKSKVDYKSIGSSKNKKEDEEKKDTTKSLKDDNIQKKEEGKVAQKKEEDKTTGKKEEDKTTEERQKKASKK